MTVSEFQETVWEYYAHHSRSMPWRTDHSPYNVLVSELMLQQTQVARVIPKFEAFITSFPDVRSLAQASLRDVLILWQGLGYNRRARFLHEAAKMVVSEFQGDFPTTQKELERLPGVGKNTAGAILAYAFDTPVVFIETNIRTVLFHSFFEGGELVDDARLLELMRECLPEPPRSIREWYWALMDYGSHLKHTLGGRLDQSTQYRKQAPLRGSVREVRGQIIKLLTEGPFPESEVQRKLQTDERFTQALEGLVRDRLVTRVNNTLRLTS